MKIEPDDYFSNGLIEMARFGTNTVLKNNMTENQRNRLIKKQQKEYPRIKKKINRRIRSIRKQVSKCNPIQLLSFASDVFLMNNRGISSEIESSSEAIFVSRMTEYIQSIIASTPIKYRPTKRDPSLRFFKIQKQLVSLHKLIQCFYFCWSACFDKLFPDYDNDTRKILFESQLLYLVRGHRYQFLEFEYYERLLVEHDEVFTNTFGISSYEIIEGIKKLQYALSQGKLDTIYNLRELMDDYFEARETDVAKFNEMYPEAGRDFADNFLGTKLRDVIAVTGWPEKLVRSLSWEINECCDFFGEKEFSGWPVVDLPIQKRPFIKIGDKYYCFDYYSFIDNFYRAIQKAVSRENPSYRWSDFQKEASEKMVGDVFSQILPGCSVLRGNYYPIKKSLKKLAENDLLIRYGNVLLIVEVKAGSFVFTAPLTDFDNHIVSYQNLIEKADKQCKSTHDYLLSSDEAIIYNQDASIKTKINMREIKDIFTISVTIDNINDYAARAEKLKFLELKSKAICISIDDLMVYREFFDSSLVFLHFLQQRRQATQESKLALNDELDHLGMYIKVIAKEASNLISGTVDDVVAFTHPYGCSQMGEDQENTRRILADLVNHPNAGGVLVLGLGCENSGIDILKEHIGTYDPKRVKFVVAQEHEDEVAASVSAIQELIEYAGAFHREEVSASNLIVGLKCGGSDGLSGITANPLVGKFSDMLISTGGTTILTEVPEMFGAETFLMNRCADKELFDQTVALINNFKEYFLRHGQTIYENPSPGNKKGGISTLEDKSLGCTQKSGRAPVKGVLSYGEQVNTPGLNLLSAPGNDLVASTALAAAGAQMVLFTTGRGTPFACPVPTIKIATNTVLAAKKAKWIDFNAGVLVEGAAMQETAENFFSYVMEVASGKKVCSEEAGFHDMAIFKQGVTL